MRRDQVIRRVSLKFYPYFLVLTIIDELPVKTIT